MRWKLLILLAVSSLLFVACGNKDKSIGPDLEHDSGNVEEQQNEEGLSESQDEKEGKEEEKEQGDYEVREDYIEEAKAHVKELAEVKEATTENYKKIQEIHRKYENTASKGLEIEEEEKVHLEKLFEEANKVEENIEKESKETIAFMFLEKANGLQAVKGEGVVKKGLEFDRVEVEVNEKKFDTEVDDRKFTLKRKLVMADKVKEAIVRVYKGDKVVEEVKVAIEAI